LGLHFVGIAVVFSFVQNFENYCHLQANQTIQTVSS